MKRKLQDFKLTDVVIEITKRCNFKCVHCGSGCTDIPGEELTTEEWIPVIQELSGIGVKKIVFSGGEPTIKKGIERLFGRIAGLGMEYGVISNGFAMSDRMINALVKDKPFAVGFSVDGMEKTHNRIRRNQKSWENCMESIRRVKEAKLPICIVTTINAWNCRELDELAKLADSLKAECWQLQLTFPGGRARQQNNFLINEKEFLTVFRKITEFRRKYPDIRIEAADCFAFAPAGLIRDDDWSGCQAGITSIGIDASGNVMPCLAMRAAAVCGNIKETSIKDIWENSDKFDFNRNFNPDSVIGKCRNCEILDYCRGGCGSFSLFYNGHFHDAPFCEFREALRKGGAQDARKECTTAD